MNLKIIIRWSLVAALLTAAALIQERFSTVIAAAMKLPYDAPAKGHDSMMAAIEIAASTVLFFLGVILLLFNIQWHRRARKTS